MSQKGSNKPSVLITVAVKRLVREHGKTYAPQYALAFCFMAVASGCTALTAWMMKDVVNRIFVERDHSALVWVSGAVFGLFLAKGLASYLQEVSLTQIGNRIITQTQKRMYDHLLSMGLSFYHQHTSTDLMNRLVQSARAVRETMNLVAVSFGRDLLTLIGLIVVMIVQDPLLSALCLLGGPVIAVSLRSMAQRVKRIAHREYLFAAEAGTTLRETAQGIRVVKSFQLEDLLRQRMFAALSRMEQLNNKIVRVQARISPIVEVLAGAAIALGVFYAGWRSLSFGESPGQFFAFITALLLAADPARRLSRLHLQLTKSATGLSLMYEILDAKPVEADRQSGPPLVVKGAQIAFENVSFSYNKGTPVLDNLSFIADPGKTTALVGFSGSGKSTIFNLILRFWLPREGAVLIDGQPIGQVSVASLREQIALVSQDLFLFEGSIRDNIGLGKPSASREQIVAAARAAHAHEFILSLPNGYDTEVGELGSQLSGGQKQRIALARAFLKDAPIVLLDEPTSALDSETELAIRHAMQQLSRGRTTLIIAHRLATVIDADRILVIERGRVAEAGTHLELVEANGRYARLFRLQFAGGREASSDTKSLVPEPDALR